MNSGIDRVNVSGMPFAERFFLLATSVKQHASMAVSRVLAPFEALCSPFAREVPEHPAPDLAQLGRSEIANETSAKGLASCWQSLGLVGATSSVTDQSPPNKTPSFVQTRLQDASSVRVTARALVFSAVEVRTTHRSGPFKASVS